MQKSYRIPKKMCLKQNDLRDKVSSAFGDLRTRKDFTDVTLTCEDGQQVEAHKVVLKSSSPSLAQVPLPRKLQEIGKRVKVEQTAKTVEKHRYESDKRVKKKDENVNGKEKSRSRKRSNSKDLPMACELLPNHGSPTSLLI